jgi:predicted transcriptional regulator
MIAESNTAFYLASTTSKEIIETYQVLTLNSERKIIIFLSEEPCFSFIASTDLTVTRK